MSFLPVKLLDMSAADRRASARVLGDEVTDFLVVAKATFEEAAPGSGAPTPRMQWNQMLSKFRVSWSLKTTGRDLLLASSLDLGHLKALMDYEDSPSCFSVTEEASDGSPSTVTTLAFKVKVGALVIGPGETLEVAVEHDTSSATWGAQISLLEVYHLAASDFTVESLIEYRVLSEAQQNLGACLIAALALRAGKGGQVAGEGFEVRVDRDKDQNTSTAAALALAASVDADMEQGDGERLIPIYTGVGDGCPDLLVEKNGSGSENWDWFVVRPVAEPERIAANSAMLAGRALAKKAERKIQRPVTEKALHYMGLVPSTTEVATVAEAFQLGAAKVGM